MRGKCFAAIPAPVSETSITAVESREKRRTEMKVVSNHWHTLRVEFKGNHFTVTLDGKKAIEWDDTTFKDSGRVGVWTKADSVTVFDDFTYSQRSE